MSAVTTTAVTPLTAPAPPAAATIPAGSPPRWASASRQSIPAARLVAATDVAALAAAAVVVLAPAALVDWTAQLGDLFAARVTVRDIGIFAAFALLVAVAFEVAGLYEAALVRRRREELTRAAGATGLVACAIAAAAAAGEGAFSLPLLLQLWAGGFAAVALTRTIRARVTRSAAGSRRVLVVGSGPHALRICRELSTDPLTSYRVLGFLDTSDTPRSAFVRRRTLGTFDQLEAILVREHVDEVHIGLPVKSHYPEIQDTIRVCERIGVKAMYRADLFGTALARPHVAAGWPAPRIELQMVTEGPVVAIKRFLDIAGAGALLVLLSPLMLLTALAVKLTSEGPVIFAQERYGLNRRRFRMLKFRTMVQNAEKLQAALESRNEAQGPVFKIARDPRITPIGHWLRRTSIDELPQLFNVLRGDMSLIGPRPLPLRDVAQFTRASDMRRFSVRPGITGLWQVSGRSQLGFDQWIRLDLHYIDNWSLLLDFRILARTIPAVVRGTGAA